MLFNLMNQPNVAASSMVSQAQRHAYVRPRTWSAEFYQVHVSVMRSHGDAHGSAMSVTGIVAV